MLAIADYLRRWVVMKVMDTVLSQSSQSCSDGPTLNEAARLAHTLPRATRRPPDDGELGEPERTHAELEQHGGSNTPRKKRRR